jgi:rod shape-determining protein MreC
LKHHSKVRAKGRSGRLRAKSLVGFLPLPLMILGSASGFLMAAAAGLMVFSVVAPQSVSNMRVMVTDLAAPVLSVVSLPLQKTAIFVRDVSGLAQIQADNARLSAENAKLREWYQSALLLEAENKSLRELLNLRVEPENRYITARILSDSGSAFAKSLLVSAGQQDGVRKGQAVISGEGVVGRIVEAGQNASRVLLISDMNSRVPILVEDSRQHAIFAGDNQQEGALMHVPADGQIAVGARIVTSGQGGMFPAGLPVGKIKGIENGEIKVEPFADFTRLHYVRIIDRPEDPNLVESARPPAFD